MTTHRRALVLGTAGLATAAVLQAVDGVALKSVVDLWSDAAQERALWNPTGRAMPVMSAPGRARRTPRRDEAGAYWPRWRGPT